MKQNYNNAYNREIVVQIHLFGIKYGKLIRIRKYSALSIIKEAQLNESYVAELNKGFKLSEVINLPNDELNLSDLASILKSDYSNAKSGESVASIFLFGIKYGQLIRRRNISSNDIIKQSKMNESYIAELNKGIKLSIYI